MGDYDVDDDRGEPGPVWAWAFLILIVAGISASVYGGIQLARWLT